LPYVEEALAMDRKLYKDLDSHPSLSKSLHNMGLVLRSLGRLEDALPFFEEALIMDRKLHNRFDGHPDLAASLNGLGSVLWSLGRAEKACRTSKNLLLCSGSCTRIRTATRPGLKLK